ncbi:MAG: DUF448 domain-containing protein [Pseudomonadota bacterium]
MKNQSLSQLQLMETARKRRREGEAPLLHMSAKAIPERRCALTGQTAPKPTLLRLVLSPDGALMADLKQRLPGRGLYVCYDRKVLEKAARSPKLKNIAAKQFGVDASCVAIDANFAEGVAEQLKGRMLSMLGLERKAGRVFLGADSVEKAAGAGKVAVLLNARDGAGDSSKFLARAKAACIPAVTLFSRTELSLAMGRENVVHAALAQRGGWKTLLNMAQSYEIFIGHTPQEDDVSAAALDDTTREGSETT